MDELNYGRGVWLATVWFNFLPALRLKWSPLKFTELDCRTERGRMGG